MADLKPVEEDTTKTPVVDANARCALLKDGSVTVSFGYVSYTGPSSTMHENIKSQYKLIGKEAEATALLSRTDAAGLTVRKTGTGETRIEEAPIVEFKFTF